MDHSRSYKKRRSASQGKLAMVLLLFWSLFASSSVCCGQGSVSAKKVEGAPAPCGPRALHVALSLLGASIDLDSCLQLTEVDPNGTTTLANIQAAASTLGYDASGMRLTPEELARLTVPAILHVTLPSEAQHFLVYQPGDGSHIRLIDPSVTGLAEAFAPDQLGLMWEGDCLVFTSSVVAAKLKVALGRISVVALLCLGCVLGVFAGLVLNSVAKRHRGDMRIASIELMSRPAAICYAVAAVIGSVSMIVTTVCLVDPIKYLRGPQLIMNASTLDLGDVKGRKPIYASMWIGNNGAKPLVIDPNKLKSSCSCLGARLSNSRVEPGNKEVLSIRVGSRPKLGAFEYSLLIPYGDSRQRERLKVKGNVVGPGGTVFPPRLYFGRFRDWMSAKRTLRYVLNRQDVKIIQVSSDLPYVKCKLARKDSAAFSINISFSQSPGTGPFEGTIKIKTNDPETEYAEIVVPFSGIVEPEGQERLSAVLQNRD